MALWILRRLGDSDYDQNRAMVVRARTPPRARKIAADAAPREQGVWLSKKESTCIEVTPDGEERVILIDNVGA